MLAFAIFQGDAMPIRDAGLLAALSLSPVAASAAVFTVGPGGTHASVQQAVTAAVNAAGDDEVRIAQGVWNERLEFTHFNDERLDISGGWNAGFAGQVSDPAATRLDGGRGGLTVQLMANDGVVTLRNLALTGGRTARIAGNLRVTAVGDAVVEFSDCLIFAGEVLSATDGYGAGGQLAAYEDSLVSMQRCEVRDNLIQTGVPAGWGGGLYLTASQNGTLRLVQVEVHDNRTEGGYGIGAGLTAELLMQSRLEVFDSRFVDNRAAGTSPVDAVASGIYFNLYGEPHAAQVEFRRNQVLGNAVETGAVAPQMMVYGGGGSSVVLGDSVIAGSARGGGLLLERSGAATMALVNLTLADNDGLDLDVAEGVAVSNTLADTVSGDIGSATVLRSRFGGEPGYSNRMGGDYSLQPGAPAVNAGTLAPIGGVGDFDVAGGTRVLGYRIDQGAYEALNPTLFVDGFDDPQ